LKIVFVFPDNNSLTTSASSLEVKPLDDVEKKKGNEKIKINILLIQTL
jgi:hypothetical protein